MLLTGSIGASKDNPGSLLPNMIEASKKPVVAAVHGTCLGGGHEIALASHYRVADVKARLVSDLFSVF